MKIENIAGPSIPGVNGAQTEMTGPSARDRALAKLLGNPQAQSHPVSNPTNISPEEASVVIPPSGNTDTRVEASDSAPLNPSAEAPAEEKAPDPLSSQYAMLARKERAIRAREAAIRAKEAEIESKRQADAAPKAPSFDESKYISKDKLLEDTFGTLNELGLGYDELTERALNAPRPEQMALVRELKALKQEIQAIKGETESNKKSFEESQKQQYEQAVSQISRDAQTLIKSDPSFELVRETGSVRDVVKLIERTFSEDGYLMTVEEAAQMVEDHLLERAERVARTKKVQQRLAPREVAKQQVSQSAQPQQLKTLTNAVSSSRKLSARERALLAFEGKKIT